MPRGPKVTENEVNAIKAIYKAIPEVKAKDIAKLFERDVDTVRGVKRGEYDHLHMAGTKKNLGMMSRCVTLMDELVEVMEGECR